jgi:uncharacterized protein YutE (UPF0331/DUF86 family)
LRELSEALSDWERNVLVHIYWGLDMEIVYEILQNDREPLMAFRDGVKKILQEDIRGAS